MELARNSKGDEVRKKPHLTEYYYFLQERLWVILSVLSVTVLITALFVFSMKPVYRSTAKLVIDKETQRSPLTGERVEYENYASQQLTFQTHFKMVTSRPVLELVLAKVDMTDASLEKGIVSRFFGAVKGNIKKLMGSVFSGSQDGRGLLSPKERLLAARIEGLRNKIGIEEVRNTRLLNIHVQDHDPEIARDIANAVAETYMHYDSSTRLETSRKMLDWLSGQLYDMKKKVEDAEKAFLAFKEEENLFSIEGKQKINVQKIEEMNGSYIDARTQRLEVEAKIKALKEFIGNDRSRDIRDIPSFLKNKLIEELYVQLLNTEIDYRELSKVYKHKHPEMLKVNSKIEELRLKIREQIKKALNNARAERAVLLAREQALQDAMNRYEKEAIYTNRKELQYAILEREVASNRELYNTLLAKIKEADITDEITNSNLRLVEPAAVPIRPVKPKKMLDLTLSVILGLFAGVGLAFFLDYMDQTVHGREDAENVLGLPVLSEIPLEDKEYFKIKQNEKHPIPSILDLPLTGRFSDAFRMLATNLKFSRFDRPRGVYLVTSTVPGEGKSTCCFNLGLTTAKLGIRTLIVEADLRLPVMRKILGQTEASGVTDILVDIFNTQVGDGTLSDLAIGDILKLLEIQEKSGILHCENDPNTFMVSVHKGQIVNVDWLSRPPKTRLGNLLVQTGKITREQSQIALAKQQSTCQRLGQVLLHLGFVSAEDLAGPLKLHIQENISQLHKCGHARFRFEEQPELVSPASDTKEAALRQAMGRLDGGSPQSTPFLLGQIEQHLCDVPDSGKLWILPSGKIPPNPADLLASSRMRVLVGLLRQQFDLILLDSPPMATASDTAILASLCDAAVLVIKMGATQFSQIQRSQEQLEALQIPIAGTILNMLDMKKAPHYYYRYSYSYESLPNMGEQAI
jgi:uncharacterized protein involved in exopolysaccharide biosynthesis/Mrp family chromosome partitioning ATPase